MEKNRDSSLDIQEQVKAILPAALEVITRPREFYAQMPNTGGFLPPLVFMIVLGIVSGLVSSILSLINLAPAGAMFTGLASFIIVPIVVGIFGFIAAAILFIIWKIMGSQESYETAYRSMAYTSAIMPITTVLNFIPYLGVIIGLLWVTYLLVVASTEVHAIKANKAWIGFGAVCAILVLVSVSAEIASRKMARNIQTWEMEMKERTGNLERLEEMTPEEAGQALGQFFKGLQGAAEDREK